VQWGSKRCLANYPLPEPLAEAIAAARQRLGRSESLLAALANAAEGSGEGETDGEPAIPAEDGEAGPSDQAVPSSDEPTTCLPDPDPGYWVPREGMPPGSEGIPPPPPAGFYAQFDAAAVRAQAERFAPYQAILQSWLRSEVLPLEKLGLALLADEPALTAVDEPEGHLRAAWKWPEARFAEECLLAVCPTEPTAGDDPQQLAAHWREPVNTAQWTAEESGRLIPLEKSWEGSSVAVWAVIDLGFQKLFSPPLILGQIPVTSGEQGRSRWKWPPTWFPRAPRAPGRRQSEPEEPT
jgi:hypothetical protein